MSASIREATGTPSAAAIFNGDGKADILWQNADGQAAVWLMNGTSLIAGANVGVNPGLSWHALNTGDFNGDGKADIVWQNTDGTPAVWLMNGTSVVSGANIGVNPGADWHVIPQHQICSDSVRSTLPHCAQSRSAIQSPVRCEPKPRRSF